MFEFRFSVDKQNEGIFGTQLKAMLARFHGENRDTCWLHILEEPREPNTNDNKGLAPGDLFKRPDGSIAKAVGAYRNYCINNLCQNRGPKNNPIRVIRTYNIGGNTEPSNDPRINLLREFEKLVFFSDDERIRNLFETYILPYIDSRFLGSYASGFRKYYTAMSFQDREKIKPSLDNRSAVDVNTQLNNEIFKIIELYCKVVGPLIIDVSNMDSTWSTSKLFFIDLVKKIPTKLCLVTTTYQREKIDLEQISLPDSAFFEADVSKIVKHIVERLIRQYFNLTTANEKILRTFILNECQVSTIEQVAEIVRNVFELSKAKIAIQRPNVNKLAEIDFSLIKKHYLLPSNLDRVEGIVNTDKEVLTIEEIRIRFLCSILGPYIKLDNLKQIYTKFFEQNYPENIRYSTLFLVHNDGMIKYTNLSAYDKARQEQKIYKQQVQSTSKKKIQDGVSECESMSQHIEELYAQRNLLPQVMGVRIQEAIIFSYGLYTNQSGNNLERGLSGSSERAPIIIKKSSTLSLRSPRSVELIVNCFNELIDHYQIDLGKAYSYFRVFADFLDDIDMGGLKFDDVELAKMIFVEANDLKKEDKPYGKLDPSLHGPLTKILANMCRVAYFLRNFWSIRKYIYQVYLLQAGDPQYRPLLEAGVGLLVTQTAENQLKTYIENELAHPSVVNPALPNLEFESYMKSRRLASKLALSVDARLRSSVFEHAFTACMEYAINAGFSLRYDVSAMRLLDAYEKAKEGKDYAKAALALGNAVLLLFCAGGIVATLKEKCVECIALCEKYNPYPIPIIQGFLNFANYFDGTVSSTEGFNLEIQTAEPNHFFINFTTLLILFCKGDYAACVNLCERMRQLEFQGGEDNTRASYCIWRSFKLLEAVSLLRYHENNPEEITTARIWQLRYTLKAYEVFTKQFPENFDYRYKFLIAEISRSRLSKEIIGLDMQSLDEQEKRYEEADDLAVVRGNLYYCKEIKKVLKRIRDKKALLVQSKVVTQQPENITANPVGTNVNEKSSNDYVDELKLKTDSKLIVLFIYNEKTKRYMPKLVHCNNEVRKTVALGDIFTDEVYSMDKSPSVDVWHHPVVQRSAKSRKLIYYSAAECKDAPFLQVQQVHNLMSIPIIKDNVVVAILYFHGCKDLGCLDDNHLKMFNNFASSFFALIDKNPAVLPRVNNKKYPISKSRSMSTNSSANTSASAITTNSDSLSQSDDGAFTAITNKTTSARSSLFVNIGPDAPVLFKSPKDKSSDGKNEKLSFSATSTDGDIPKQRPRIQRRRYDHGYTTPESDETAKSDKTAESYDSESLKDSVVKDNGNDDDNDGINSTPTTSRKL